MQQLQFLLLKDNPAANDLPDGDSGIEGRSIRKRGPGGAAKKRGSKKRPLLHSYGGYEWTAEEHDGFVVDALLGKLVAGGTTSYANLDKVQAGTLIYQVMWSGFPADLLLYEPAKNIGSQLVADFEAAEVEEAAQAEADAREEAELEADVRQGMGG